ncbi:SDR family oxidoreductase [bacterium]|nr:SDR family oxidoreductase [bacterium]
MRTVIITGGTKGIGAEISRKFHQEHWSVVIASRKPSGLTEELGDNCLYVMMDVRKEEDHIRVVEETLKWTGRLDCYVNCAGFSKWAPVNGIDEDFWNKMIDTNLKGTFWGCTGVNLPTNSARILFFIFLPAIPEKKSINFTAKSKKDLLIDIFTHKIN